MGVVEIESDYVTVGVNCENEKSGRDGSNCYPGACRNGGFCVQRNGLSECQCTPGFAGTR